VSPTPLRERGGGIAAEAGREEPQAITHVAYQTLRLLEAGLSTICGALLAGLLALVLISVTLRYGFGAGLLGADELAIWLHVALIGFGAPLLSTACRPG
jgi:TRAP-type C4-dicarboxylate transport system permease small subunit